MTPDEFLKFWGKRKIGFKREDNKIINKTSKK